MHHISSTPPHVLVVDDDRAVRASLERALGLHELRVSTAEHGLDALDALAGRAADADVVVLDVAMPGVDGLGVARRLRADGDDRPILMLTARDAVGDRVAGLDAGADDYLAKPFALEELLARLRALLRRTLREQPHAPGLLRFADLELDTAGMRVHRAGHEVGCTRTEFLLLELFMDNPRRVLARDVIMDRVWGLDREGVVQRAGGLRGLPASQARGAWRGPSGADRAWCGLRAARGRLTWGSDRRGHCAAAWRC